jgi:hypothetical protein
LVLLAALPAAAEDPGQAESIWERLVFGGFADVYYAYNDNHPDDHNNFIPGTGTTAKHGNEFSLNLAQLDLTLAPEPVGFRIVLGFGDGVEVVHAAERDDTWENVIQASVSYDTGIGRGLLLEGGIYPSHVGFEAFASKDNWNYTRSWLGEFSPYYQTGVKATYPFSKHWSGQLHFLNGWQIIGENNDGKTVGTQLAWSSPKLSASFNALVGPELANNDDDLRLFGDLVVTWRPSERWSFGAGYDRASEQRPAGADDVEWSGIAGYARLAWGEGRSALALRAEYFDDPDASISGFSQRLREATLTFEHRPRENMIVKLEARHDRSSAAVFGEDAGLTDSQTLILAGIVATFELGR